MNLPQIVSAIQESSVGEWMRYTRRAMPLIEATHVLAAITVFGTVMVVDLRLMGLAHARRAFERVSRDMLPITWGAFCIALITGALMFTTSAQTYFANPAFRVKMLALLAAGLNMAVFQLVTLRGRPDLGGGKSPPAARVAGLISLLLWAAVVLLGRWIGFTKSYDFIPPVGELDFTN